MTKAGRLAGERGLPLKFKIDLVPVAPIYR